MRYSPPCPTRPPDHSRRRTSVPEDGLLRPAYERVAVLGGIAVATLTTVLTRYAAVVGPRQLPVSMLAPGLFSAAVGILPLVLGLANYATGNEDPWGMSISLS